MMLPAQLGRFIPREVLGEGAQGVVLRAFDPVLDVEVALKVLHPAFATDTDVIERLRREALLVRRVNHPAVARIHDVVDDDGRTFLVMDLAPGVPLSRLLNSGALSPLTAVRIVRKAALGLAAAHRVGVVHRDVKPENLVVDLDGGADAAGDAGVRLVDFGVARAQDLAPLTETGLVIGTRRYVAPEIWMGAPATSLSDVFSLGVVLYQCLTGRHPFDGAADTALRAEAPSTLVTTLPASLDALTLQTVSPLPRDRTASAEQLAGALLRIEDELLSPTAPMTTTTKTATTKRSRAAIGVVLALVATTAIGVAVTTTKQPTTTTTTPPLVVTPPPPTTATAPPPSTPTPTAAPTPKPTKPKTTGDLERRRQRAEAELRAVQTALGHGASYPATEAALSAVHAAPDAATLQQATQAARAVLATVPPTAAAVDATLLKANQRYAVADPAQQALMRPLMAQAAEHLRRGRARAAWDALIAAQATLPTP